MITTRAHYTSDIPEVDRIDPAQLLDVDVLLNELGELVIEYTDTHIEPPQFPHYTLVKFYELP